MIRRCYGKQAPENEKRKVRFSSKDVIISEDDKISIKSIKSLKSEKKS